MPHHKKRVEKTDAQKAAIAAAYRKREAADRKRQERAEAYIEMLKKGPIRFFTMGGKS